ncbi:MAG: bifunctional diguanylate cyclase/phosphodiesterase [Paraglaciecola sp.]|nr:bifunctional diguanylate cyclase/phosphodiesterase [Paraglaciecola sp.]
MLHVFALSIILLGTILLLFSLGPVNHIYKTDNNAGWRVLRALVLFFIAGYLGVSYYFFLQSSLNAADVMVSTIMFAGACFVALVVRFSLSSLNKLEQSAAAERSNALHDSLTGLPNRKFLMDCLQEHIDARRYFNLLILDLNRFKQINDALGHYVGDLLLIRVGQKLKQALPSDIQLFRLGGDEFAIVSTKDESAHTRHIVDIIHHSLETTFEIEDYELSVSASIGVTHFPENGQSIGVLLQQGDLAMYASKKHSNLYTEYDESLESGAAEKVHIAAQLKEAISLEKFELWYQPIIDLSTNSIHGAEALLRWPQADGSYIAPDKFIKVAEQSALINRITEWVMQRVSEDIESFSGSGLELCIHINLSVKDLQDPMIVSKVRKVLTKHAMKDHKLMLEVTESAMMTDIAQVKNTMQQISEAGLVFSIDDFGTGYSSLALLRDLPVGQIKIDRSFIRNIANSNADLAIVKSTIYLAQNLGCNIVAEGVEDAETANLLTDLGCDFVQGYYYSKPQRRDDFVYFVQQYDQQSAVLLVK